jgi:methyl-accepting chemotaxis protein
VDIQASRHEALESRQLLNALKAFKRGDFSVRLRDDLRGIDGEIAAAFNEIVDLNEQMTHEFERLSKVVGKARSHSAGGCAGRPAAGSRRFARSTT